MAAEMSQPTAVSINPDLESHHVAGMRILYKVIRFHRLRFSFLHQSLSLMSSFSLFFARHLEVEMRRSRAQVGPWACPLHTTRTADCVRYYIKSTRSERKKKSSKNFLVSLYSSAG